MEFGDDDEGVLEPVSPSGHYFNSSVLSISNLCVLESEVPIDESQIMPSVNNVFLSITSRLSSIMVENNYGEKKWKRVEVKLEEHVYIPIFPPSLSPESYDKYFDDYISNLALEKLPQHKPLWEIHIIKYPTSNAAGNLIFKLHHALGDGFSLMSALLSCLKRADDTSLPLTFPSRKRSEPKSESFVSKVFSTIFNTVLDFSWGIWSGIMVEDDLTPIRSGNDGIEFNPITVSTMTFSLDQIKLIKTKLGVTVNDVLTGMTFLGTRLYMQEIDQSSSKAQGTAVVLLSTRMMVDYTSIQEMMKPDSKVPWGNRFTLLQVDIPNFTTDFKSPLDFVWKAQQIIKRKRNSLGIYLTSRFLDFLNKFGGHEAVAKYIRSTLKNSSMVVSNMIGPVEQMAVANHPIKGLYFLIFGSPEGLDVTIVSYMGKVRVAFKMEKGLIDPQKFKSCMETAFEMIVKASDKKS